MIYPDEFQAIARKAVSCSDCFCDGRLKRPMVDRAQPRWIGPAYSASSLKVVLMLLNPGSGDGRIDGADAHFRDLLHSFEQGADNLEAILQHQRNDIANWGRGKLLKFLSHAGLQLDQIALMNIAWCATSQNRYPAWMLRNCFQRHTRDALKSLEPDVIILSGSPAHPYGSAINDELPNVRVLRTLHYAHREGAAATQEAATLIRSALTNFDER